MFVYIVVNVSPHEIPICEVYDTSIAAKNYIKQLKKNDFLKFQFCEVEKWFVKHQIFNKIKNGKRVSKSK